MKHRGIFLLTVCGMLAVQPVLPAFAADAEPSDEVVMTATVTLNGDSASADGENVTVDGSKITVSASGNYLFSGTLNDGQIAVNVPDTKADTGTVRLYFQGVNIKGVSEAALYVINAENTSVNLMDGTENFLSDGAKYTKTEAVIFAKDDITIKAGGPEENGKLTVTAAYQHAVHCNNDVKITGGDIKIRTAEGDGIETGIGDGIRGKTSVQIKGGKLDVNAGGDGIKSTKGYVTISDGNTDIKAGKDAVQGETAVTVSGGSLKANGDRGLTNANDAEGNVITVTGGTILATATDRQAVVANNTQPVLLFKTTEQQLKDQRIELYEEGSDTAVFSKKPDKKFNYVLISSPDLKAGSKYTLSVGGAATEAGVITLGEEKTELPDVVCAASAVNYDINGDELETVADAVMLCRVIAEDTTLSPTDYAAGRLDVNRDGLLTLKDVLNILRYIAQNN
ncbi:MAG: carbohydrate-binding domain-containing protein [Oscillospiraceae bacterium]|nr:carbohydrate-binding domain-containing protein [Oscillospiraceae bacterium]